MRTKKNANDVHLQWQRIVAFLNLYLHCIGVGKTRQCVTVRRCVVGALYGQRVKCVFTHLIRVHRCPRASNYPVGPTLRRRCRGGGDGQWCAFGVRCWPCKLTSSGFSVFVGYWHRDAVIEWTSHSKCALVWNLTCWIRYWICVSVACRLLSVDCWMLITNCL